MILTDCEDDPWGFIPFPIPWTGAGGSSPLFLFQEFPRMILTDCEDDPWEFIPFPLYNANTERDPRARFGALLAP